MADLGDETPGGRLLAISAGRAAPLAGPSGAPAASGASPIISGFVKTPISTLRDPVPIELTVRGVDGDEQVDLSVHGGLDQAVYVYPAEHYAFWRTVRMQAKVMEELAEAGAMAENLTVTGLLERDLWVGDRMMLSAPDGGPGVELLVTRPRRPCYKFNIRMGFSAASKMMEQSGFSGWYCAVIRPGKLAAGASVHVRRGDRFVSIEEVRRLKSKASQPGLF